MRARICGRSASSAKRRYRSRATPSRAISPLRLRERRGLPLVFTERSKQAFDAVEEHADFRHVAAQEAVDEAEFLRRRQSVVDKPANLAPIGRLRIRIAHAAGNRHRVRRKVAEELRIGATAAQRDRGTRFEISIEDRRRAGSERRARGKAVDDRHVHEDAAHVVAVALAMALVERARRALGLGRRVPGADQAAPDFRGGARDGVRIQRVAAEKVDLLQLREQAGTGVAAGDALHLGDRQGFARAQPIRVELAPVVEMARDDEQVTANALPAGRGEPIGTAALHQLHELVLVFGQALPKDLFFVRRIDGDGANRASVGVRRRAETRREQRDQQNFPGRPGKGSQTHGYRHDTSGQGLGTWPSWIREAKREPAGVSNGARQDRHARLPSFRRIVWRATRLAHVAGPMARKALGRAASSPGGILLGRLQAADEDVDDVGAAG